MNIRHVVMAVFISSLVLVLSQPLASLAATVSTTSDLSVTGSWSGSFLNYGETLTSANTKDSWDQRFEALTPFPQISPPVTVSSFVSDGGASAGAGGTTPVSVPNQLTTSSADAMVSASGDTAFSDAWLSGEIRSDVDQTVTLTFDYTWNSDTPTSVVYVGVGFLSPSPSPLDLLLASKNGFTPVIFTDFDGSNPYLTMLLQPIIGVTNGADTVSWTLPVVKDVFYEYVTGVIADTDDSAGVTLPVPGPVIIIPNPGNGPGPVPGPGLAFVTPIPIPAAIYLFGSGLLSLVGVTRRKRT